MIEMVQRVGQFEVEVMQEPVNNRDYLILAGIYKQAHPELDRGSQSLVHLKETFDHLADPDNPNTALLVARRVNALGSRAVGAAMLYVMGEPESGRRGTVIEEIFVDKRSRGHRIGALLLDTITEIAEKNGSQYIQLASPPQTKGSIRLFTEAGFSENRLGAYRRKISE